MLALRALGDDTLPLGEGQLAVLAHVDEHDVARLPRALEQLLGQRVLHVRLDGTTQRAGAVDRVGALLGQQVLSGVRELDGHALPDEAVPQLAHHEVHDAANLVLRERLEHHDLVHTVEELRAEKALELAHRATLDLLVGELAGPCAKAHRAGLGDFARAHVGRHDDDGVGEVNLAALAVREPALVKDLQQEVEDVRVGLLDLVEEHHGVRTAPHGLGELAALVVAHVSGRGAHELAHGELLHELAHVKGDERLLGAKEELGETLGQLGLAHARRAQEDERAAGATRVLERRAAAADGARHGAHGLVLADDALVQHALAAQELGGLGLGEVGDRHARDGGDHVGDGVGVDGHHVLVEALVPGVLELAPLGHELLLAVTELGGLLELLGIGRLLLVGSDAGQLLVDLGDLGRQHHVVHARAGARLVDDVDGLVRQEAVLDVAVGQRDGGLERGVGVVHVVVLLVTILQAMDDGQRVGDAGLVDVHRLEAALERGVLLDVLAVLVGRRGADDLDLAARQGRLEDAGGVDGALRRARADDGVDLVDEEDDVAGLLHLGDDPLETVLELAAVLGAGHERGHVKRPDLLVAQHVGHGARRDELGQALDDGRLAHARVAQDEWVVLLAARQHLHDALHLAVAADHGVELALGGKRGEVAAVLLEHGGVVRGGRLLAGRANRHAVRPDANLPHLWRRVGGLVLVDELVHGVAHRVAGDAQAAERLHGHAVALAHDAQ